MGIFKAKESLNMRVVRVMKANSLQTKNIVSESMCTATAHFIKANGKMTKEMGKAG